MLLASLGLMIGWPVDWTRHVSAGTPGGTMAAPFHRARMAVAPARPARAQASAGFTAHEGAVARAQAAAGGQGDRVPRWYSRSTATRHCIPRATRRLQATVRPGAGGCGGTTRCPFFQAN